MIPQDVGTEVGRWQISLAELKPGNTPQDSLATRYWLQVKSLLPNDLLEEYVTSLRLYTDGPQEDLGGLNQLDESNKYWQLDLDTADINFHNLDSGFVLDYTHTLIHEFGHLLTLNATQVEPTEDMRQDDAKGYLTSEGYARKSSYLGKYVDRFWPMDFLMRWDKIDQIKNESRRADKLYTFYLENSERFVTDYAAENPEEDIAESWAFFVLSDKPVTNELKARKVLFFYQFEELVKMRNSIRSKITSLPTDYLNAYQIANND
ncbi:MAG: hypothetical protein Roseis2KO_20970 [Roseivirga sp.]